MWFFFSQLDNWFLKPSQQICHQLFAHLRETISLLKGGWHPVNGAAANQLLNWTYVHKTSFVLDVWIVCCNTVIQRLAVGDQQGLQLRIPTCAIVCSNDRQIKVPRCNAISTWLFSAASEKRNRLRLKTRLGILKESQHAHAIERVVPGSMCDNGGWQQKFTLSRSSHLGVPSVCAPFFAGI